MQCALDLGLLPATLFLARNIQYVPLTNIFRDIFDQRMMHCFRIEALTIDGYLAPSQSDGTITPIPRRCCPRPMKISGLSKWRGTEKKGRGEAKKTRSPPAASAAVVVTPTLIHFPPYLAANYEGKRTKRENAGEERARLARSLDPLSFLSNPICHAARHRMADE